VDGNLEQINSLSPNAAHRRDADMFQLQALSMNGNRLSMETLKDFLWPIVAVGGLGTFIDFLIGRTG